MIVEYEFTSAYLFTALEAAPSLFEHLLQGVTTEEADFMPDPERFTLRETMAHLAAWELVFQQRLTLTRTEDTPTIPVAVAQSPPLENRPFVETAFLTADPIEQLQLFRQRRAETVAFLRECTASDWSRIAMRPNVGALTLEALAVVIPLHDTYHLEQIIQWRAKFASKD